MLSTPRLFSQPLGSASSVQTRQRKKSAQSERKKFKHLHLLKYEETGFKFVQDIMKYRQMFRIGPAAFIVYITTQCDLNQTFHQVDDMMINFNIAPGLYIWNEVTFLEQKHLQVYSLQLMLGSPQDALHKIIANIVGSCMVQINHDEEYTNLLVGEPWKQSEPILRLNNSEDKEVNGEIITDFYHTLKVQLMKKRHNNIEIDFLTFISIIQAISMTDLRDITEDRKDYIINKAIQRQIKLAKDNCIEHYKNEIMMICSHSEHHDYQNLVLQLHSLRQSTMEQFFIQMFQFQYIKLYADQLVDLKNKIKEIEDNCLVYFKDVFAEELRGKISNNQFLTQLLPLSENYGTKNAALMEYTLTEFTSQLREELLDKVIPEERKYKILKDKLTSLDDQVTKLQDAIKGTQFEMTLLNQKFEDALKINQIVKLYDCLSVLEQEQDRLHKAVKYKIQSQK